MEKITRRLTIFFAEKIKIWVFIYIYIIFILYLGNSWALEPQGFDVLNAVVEQKVFLESNKWSRLCTFANVLNPLDRKSVV